MPGFKVVLCGHTGSGKTTLVKKIDSEQFLPEWIPTIGADFQRIDYIKLGQHVDTAEDKRDDVQLWDCAGRPCFHPLLPTYIRDADALLLVVDLKRWSTIDQQDSTFKEEKNYLVGYIKSFREQNGNKPIYLIGNKQDVAITDLQDGKSNTQDIAIQRLITFANSEFDYVENEQTTTVYVRIPPQNILITSAKQINSNVISTSEKITPRILEPLAVMQQVYQDVKSAIPASVNKSQSAHSAPPSHDDGEELVLTPFSSEQSIQPASHPYYSNKATPSDFSWLNKGLGWIVGPFVGAFFGFLCRNPGVCLLAAFRAQEWQEWSLANLLRAYLFAPLINPIAATLYGFKDGAVYGGTHGASDLINFPGEMTKGVETRTIIAGTILSLFVAAAATVAALSLIHIALPLFLGAAAAGALIGAVSYEGYNFYKTDKELVKLKNHTTAQHTPIYLQIVEQPSAVVTASLNVLGNYSSPTYNVAKTKHHGSLRSWLQVPPAPPEVPKSTYSTIYL